MAERQVPPYVPGDPVRILSVPPGPTLSLLFLAPYRGVSMHWVQGRTRPCLGAEVCPDAWHRIPPIYYAFAAAEVWRTDASAWIPVVLEITAKLEEQLRGRSLRGEIWQLARRTAKGRGAAVDGQYVDRLHEDQVSPAFPIAEVLQAFWRVEGAVLDVPNPSPARIVLPAVARAAPPGLGQKDPPRRPQPSLAEMARLRSLRDQPATTPVEPQTRPDPEQNGAH